MFFPFKIATHFTKVKILTFYVAL